MLPETRLSSQAVLADFKSADAIDPQKLQDFEQGGVAIGDPTQGLNVQLWELRVLGDTVRVRPYPDGVYTSLFTEAGIQEIALSFDQNMNPTVAYRSAGLCKLRWYDPTPGKQKFVTTGFPGVRDLRICLDDKREERRDFSDILIFYLKDDPTRQPQRIFMRAQRDRYGVEYTVGNLPVGANALHRVGMSMNQRLRVAMWGLFAAAAAPRRDILPYPPDIPVPDGLVLDFRGVQNPWYGSAGYAVASFDFELYKPPVSDPFI